MNGVSKICEYCMMGCDRAMQIISRSDCCAVLTTFKQTKSLSGAEECRPGVKAAVKESKMRLHTKMRKGYDNQIRASNTRNRVRPGFPSVDHESDI